MRDHEQSLEMTDPSDASRFRTHATAVEEAAEIHRLGETFG